jgi:hypothetical protein
LLALIFDAPPDSFKIGWRRFRGSRDLGLLNGLHWLRGLLNGLRWLRNWARANLGLRWLRWLRGLLYGLRNWARANLMAALQRRTELRKRTPHFSQRAFQLI